MKLNNKGFAISTIMYIILVMAIVLITLTLSILSSRRLVLDKLKEEAKENIYSKLPLGYKKIEFLTISGLKYVDIDYYPNNNTSVYYDFEFTKAITTKEYIPILAERNKANGTNMYGIWINKNTGNVAYNFGTEDTSGISDTNCFGRHVYQNIKNKFYIDGKFIKEIDVDAFQTDISLSLFSLHTYKDNNLVYENRNLVGNFYSLKIYEEETLIRNLIPCEDEFDDEIQGICDLVEVKFYPLITTLVT